MGMTAELRAGVTRVFGAGALLAACGLAAAACGNAAAPSGGAQPGGGSSAGPTPAAKVSLTVVQTGGSDSTTKRWTLQCEPAGGNVPDPATACARLLQHRTIFTPPSRHVMCPMIMADARSYIVYGTFLGKKVHQTIVDGGCSLTRWSQLNQVFN